ncbi:MAG: beta-N-acetylhexosaminidase [Clostridium sp.]|nr:beta-N-acetylhexosaminidase [Clostridium sp.]
MFKKKNMDLYEDEQYEEAEEEFDEIEDEGDADGGSEELYEDDAYAEEGYEDGADESAEEGYEDGADGSAEEGYEDGADGSAEEFDEDGADGSAEEFDEDGADESAEEGYEDGADGSAEKGYEDDADAGGDYSEERSAKRVVRRKRRIRNQIIAYIVLLLIVAGLACGAFFVGKQLIRFIDSRQPAEPVEEDVTPQEVIAVNSPTVTPEPEPEPEVNPVDEVARYYIDQMTTEEKVAGLFFVTPESMMENVSQAVRAGAKTQEALGRYAVGGIIYFGSNIQSADQITEMLAGTLEMSKYPLFLGVDEEGGSVSRVADALSEVDNVGSARELGAAGDGGEVYIAYSGIGQYLTKYGFNVDFAPVADIYDGENSMFAERSFGTDADTVAMLVSQAVMGLQDNGISACVKHFPGHGSADADSHDGRATNEMTENNLMETEVVPFRMALEANPDFVMVSHISVPGITWDYTPASMSSDIVTRILRMQLGYEGIIITDAMDMGAVTTYYTSAQAAVDAINAGCDMILKPDNFKEAYQGVLDAVNNGEISIERIEESLMRIYRVKCAGMTITDVTGGAGADGEPEGGADGAESPEGGEADAENPEAENGVGGGDSLLPQGE